MKEGMRKIVHSYYLTWHCGLWSAQRPQYSAMYYDLTPVLVIGTPWPVSTVYFLEFTFRFSLGFSPPVPFPWPQIDIYYPSINYIGIVLDNICLSIDI